MIGNFTVGHFAQVVLASAVVISDHVFLLIVISRAPHGTLVTIDCMIFETMVRFSRCEAVWTWSLRIVDQIVANFTNHISLQYRVSKERP